MSRLPQKPHPALPAEVEAAIEADCWSKQNSLLVDQAIERADLYCMLEFPRALQQISYDDIEFWEEAA